MFLCVPASRSRVGNRNPEEGLRPPGNVCRHCWGTCIRSVEGYAAERAGASEKSQAWLQETQTKCSDQLVRGRPHLPRQLIEGTVGKPASTSCRERLLDIVLVWLRMQTTLTPAIREMFRGSEPPAPEINSEVLRALVRDALSKGVVSSACFLAEKLMLQADVTAADVVLFSKVFSLPPRAERWMKRAITWPSLTRI